MHQFILQRQPVVIRTLKNLALLGCAIMSGFIIYALVLGKFFIEGPQLIGMPWGLVSVVDLYLGLLIVAGWIILRENFSLSSFVWALLVLSLGNMITCIYLFNACKNSDGSVKDLLLGNKY